MEDELKVVPDIKHHSIKSFFLPLAGDLRIYPVN
jgi:hypothetical protein